MNCQSTPYKKVLPPTHWPLVEDFLTSICRYADLAREHGCKLDVSVFMTEYVAIYARPPYSAEQQLADAKIRRDERRSQGLCTKCGKNIPPAGRLYCEACIKKSREQRRRREAREAS